MPKTQRSSPGLLWCGAFLLLNLQLLPLLASAQSPEETERGWMGLYIRDLDRQDLRALDLPADQRGVVVSGVDDDGPAAQVGIEPGDVITSLDGKTLSSRREFIAVLGARRVGDRIRLQVLRRRTSRNVEFRLQERPREMQGSAPLTTPESMPTPLASAAPATQMLSCVELTDADLARYFGVSAGEGVLVLEVRGSGLDGLRAGDVIVAINDASVHTLTELQNEWRDPQDGEQTRLRVIRNRRGRDVRIEGETVLAAALARAPAGAVSGQPSWRSLRQEIDELRQRLEDLEAQVDAQVRR